MNEGFEDRVRSIRERVLHAAERSRRSPDEVTIIAATKGFGERATLDWSRVGGRDVGESYVQEAKRKRDALAGEALPLRWHLIGRLQRNKAKRAVEHFDLVHSLDGFDLAAALDRAASSFGRTIDCLIEVNLGEEGSKGGVAPAEVEDLLRGVEVFPRVRVRGLMGIPPRVADPEAVRPHFRRLREIRDRLAELPLGGGRLKELSMGMSEDFEIAVEEGATMVRIGRALFGERR